MEQQCHPTKEGVSLKGIADVCDYLKIDYTAGRVSLKDIEDCPLPCISIVARLWRKNYPVPPYSLSKIGQRTEYGFPFTKHQETAIRQFTR